MKKKTAHSLIIILAYFFIIFPQWALAAENTKNTLQLVNSLPPAFQKEMFGIAIWQILGVLLLIFISLLTQKLILFFITSKIRTLVGKILPRFQSAIDKGAKPISGLVIAMIFWIGFPSLGFSSSVEAVIRLAIRVLAVASGVWFFYRQADVLSEYLAEKASKTTTKLDDQLVPLLRRTLKTFVIVIGCLFILQNLNLDVGSLLAGLGLGGLAFALAAKDTLANFFGAITIFIDRPFQIGDWVIIDKIEGTVEDVGFRTTRIRTFYNSLITIPNATLTGTAVDNLGARRYRRIKTYLSLTYDTPPEKIQAFVEAVRAIIKAHPDTRKDFYEIHFNQYGSHSLDILLYCFLEVPTWSAELTARHEIFLSILRLAHDLGVEFAFPTQTIHVDSFPEKTSRNNIKLKNREELIATIQSFGPQGSASNPKGELLTHGFFAGHTPKGSIENEESGS